MNREVLTRTIRAFLSRLSGVFAKERKDRELAEELDGSK
jgi:hypothetical protein